MVKFGRSSHCFHQELSEVDSEEGDLDLEGWVRKVVYIYI